MTEGAETLVRVTRDSSETTAHITCPECGTIHSFKIPIDNLQCTRCGHDILRQEFIE